MFFIKSLFRKTNSIGDRISRVVEQEKNLQFIDKLFCEFKEAEVFLVGGIVRDIILGRSESKDFDLVVRKVPPDALENFLARLGIVNLVGKTFGVFKFVPEDSDLPQPIDIALPRKEHAYLTGGYRDFEVKFSAELPIEEDLSRRDFTINAMAWDFKNKRLVDLFGGLNDLEKKKIRCVGNPKERFQEDYGRMLRAIRFACQLNFEIEKDTWQALRDEMKNINKAYDSEGRDRVVPYEVIAKEFLKSFAAQPLKTLELHDASGALEQLMPELLKTKGCPQPLEFHSEGDVWQHTILALKNLKSADFKKFFGDEKAGLETMLAVLFHDIGKPATIKTPEIHGTNRIRFDEHDKTGAEMTREICQRLRFSSAEDFGVDAERIFWLVRNHMLLLSSDPEGMKKTTIEKYFFNPKYDGRGLLHLIFADAEATLGPDGKVYHDNLIKMLAKIEELKKLTRAKYLPKPILDGNEVMKILNLKPGPKVGEVLLVLREEQLAARIKTKEEAEKFVCKLQS